MRSYVKIIFALIPMAGLAVMFQQCSGVKFKNANEQNQWSLECSQDASKCRKVTETFGAGGSNKKIDFMWIVDNSGSMSQEVQKTRDNLAAFATALSGYTDLKMSLLSAKDGTTNPGDQNPQYFTIPSGMPAGTSGQLNTFVSSNDALILGGLSICPANADAGSWCSVFKQNHTDAIGRVITQARWDKVYSTVYDNSTGAGKFTSFMREQSHKVFVIVSDDDARGENPYHVKTEQFLDAYDSRFPNSMPIVYSIVSPRTIQDAANAGCSVYNQGLEYMKLSAETGGEVFDICESNWKPYFDEMLAGIQTLANTSFPLATVNIVDILSVKVNGNKLNPGDYTYANRVLKIREDIMSGYSTYTITVELLEYVN